MADAADLNVTPQRPTNIRSGLKSTPLSQGTASASEHVAYRGLTVAAISPFIGRDIMKSESCNVDDMLTQMLLRCHLNPEEAPDDLLKRCLEAVLPICNGEIEGRTNVDASSDVRANLVEYAGHRLETPGYNPFIRACNVALSHLVDVKVAGMKEASSLEILIQKNDPHTIKSMHQDEESFRKPDAATVSLHCALNVLSYEYGGAEHWSECASITSIERPRNLNWVYSLCAWEFKRLQAITDIPEHYTVADRVPTNPEYLQISFSAQDMDDMKEIAPKPQPSPAPRGSDRAGGSSNTKGSNSKRKKNESAPPTRTQPERASKSKLASKENSSTTSLVSDSLPSSNKRRKLNEGILPNPHRPPVTVQAGLYAAEMLAAHVAMTHTFNFIICDEIIWIWYYDRQGNIQSQGIDFIKDLPRFLVLLYAIQRFDLPDWGRNENFVRKSDQAKSSHAGQDNANFAVVEDINSEPMKDEVKFDHELLIQSSEGPIDITICSSTPITTHYGLKGRATNVFPVKSKALVEMYKEQGIGEDDMAGKLYWGEKNRMGEAELLKEVKRVAEDNPHIKGHVPELLWHHTFPGSTSEIRDALKLENPDRGSRVLYLLIFKKLKPITDLYGTDLLKVWWQCVVCNRELWKNGIHHRDVSCSNLMYYTDKDGKLIGVLNDFDLASLAKTPGPLGNERTGTIPFMALDLLTVDAVRGEVKHLYRHDLESFVWVLVWICMRYRNGALRGRSRKLDEWARADAIQCLEKKTVFMNRYPYPDVPRDVDTECWNVACGGLWVLDYERMQRNKRKREAQFGRAGFIEEGMAGEGFELKDDQVFARFESDVMGASLTSFA